MSDTFKLGVSASDLNSAITKANAAAPQSTTYTKAEVDSKVNSAKTTVDADLSETSTNPVQNKVIAESIASMAQRISILEQKAPTIYGWHVDSTESNPSAAVTYLLDATGKTPASMGASTFNYGSWADAFFMPKPCMVKYDGTVDYYLDPNDYTKKADGTDSDVANPNYEGNAMMEWPKIWFKFEQPEGEPDGNGAFYCSDQKIDDTYHCWCNINSKDEEVDHFYTAIYNGTGTTKLRSISGVAITSENGNGGTTGQHEIDRAVANNTTSDVEWYTDVYSDRILINSLLVLMSKSLDTQGKFGRGLDSGSQTAKEAYVTGTLNDKGLFWGNTSAGTSGVKTFGMENWWGCCWHRTAGCIMSAYDFKVKLTYGTADGSSATGYNSTGTGYISLGTAPNTNNCVSKMLYSPNGYMPLVVSGSVSTYYCDYWYQNTGTYYMLAGGSSNIGMGSGAFYFDLSNGFSLTHWIVAAALSLKPLV